MCTNLENKSYCIKNQQYEKEEYYKKKQMLLTKKDQFCSINGQLPIASNNNGSNNFSGNHIIMSHDVENGYFTNRLENAHNAICVG
ncbi:MAG: hypothetical protein H6766_03910 [Candidatus Peribacteria bacterium]|nr:MAG: hypothetical protein H6766_03910 [Candidatus Peribacteria bacterium]